MNQHGVQYPPLRTAECPQFAAKQFQPGILDFVPQKMHACRVCPRKEKCGFDLISDALPFGRLWYGEPDAISNAIGYAEFYSRSHDAVIHVYDEAGKVTETHEQ
jgi:hypothetical protein